jgi:hypothetical protein
LQTEYAERGGSNKCRELMKEQYLLEALGYNIRIFTQFGPLSFAHNRKGVVGH